MGVHLVFKGTEKSETEKHELEMFCNDKGELFINISMAPEFMDGFICLDKQSAIRLSKHLKSQIALM